ncbi:nucleotidyltransferase domain-containing protein [Candidatus Sumerlaeota bacterium]|nr:nucleotidyltransferase domain-containing protein [Candidatus Sumerlaeota bacterium]
MRLDKEKAVATLRELISHRDEVIFAYLHGSFLSGEGFNDIDIAVFVDESHVPREKVLDYEFDLARQLQEVIKFPVDVRILNYAPLGFRYYATSEQVLFSRDEERRCEFLCRTWSAYFDFLPVSELYFKELLDATQDV